MIDRIKEILRKSLLFLAIAMMIMIFINRDFFNQLGQAANMILEPIAIPNAVEIPIMIAAALTGILSTLSQKYGMDTDGQKQQREKMNELNQKIKEARMSDNDEKLEQLQKERAQMTQEMMSNLTSQFKPMLYILLVTIPIFSWVYYITNPANPFYTQQALKMTLPFLHEVNLGGTFFLGFPGWIIWYFIASLPLSQLARKILNVGI
ncbi:hypothetical protein C9439_03100 [archaeon SCG-AAA382B04]|nr:hypothetical protein C9439_03100 [archaeon SCG-AAA382B04]